MNLVELGYYNVSNITLTNMVNSFHNSNKAILWPF